MLGDTSILHSTIEKDASDLPVVQNSLNLPMVGKITLRMRIIAHLKVPAVCLKTTLRPIRALFNSRELMSIVHCKGNQVRCPRGGSSIRCPSRPSRCCWNKRNPKRFGRRGNSWFRRMGLVQFGQLRTSLSSCSYSTSDLSPQTARKAHARLPGLGQHDPGSGGSDARPQG